MGSRKRVIVPERENNRRRHPREILVSALLILPVLVGASHGRPWFARTNVEIESALGYDSNVYRQDDRGGNAVYLPFSVGLRHDLYRAAGSLIRLDTDLHGSRTAAHRRDADRSSLRLEGELRRDLLDTGAGRLRLSLEGTFRKHRRVYVSRLSGEEYFVEDGDTTVSLRDRLNATSLEGALSLSYWTPDGFGILAVVGLANKDYLEDYNHIDGIEPLDHRTHTMRLRLTFPTAWLHLRAEYNTKFRQYRDYPAVDSVGTVVVGEPRRFHYHELVARLRFDLSRDVRLDVDGEYTARRDQYAGYYDYNEWKVAPSLTGRTASRWWFDVEYQLRRRDYPRAHIYRDTERPLRRERSHLADVELGRRLTPFASLFLGAGGIWHEERNEDFSYDRFRAWVGVRLAWGVR
jgi:hypothetical protein